MLFSKHNLARSCALIAAACVTTAASAQQPAEQSATNKERKEEIYVAVDADELDQRKQNTCSPSQIRHVLKRSQSSLARVAGSGWSATGVVFGGKDYLLAPFSVVETGRGIVVELPDERERKVTIVAVDRERDLAILQLDRPARAEPLPLTADAIDVGESVLALVRSDDGEIAVEPGVVTGKHGHELRSNALETRHGHFGTPILDCEGRVVGISTGMFSDTFTPIGEGIALAKEIGRQQPYTGDWSLLHPAVGGVYHFERDAIGVGLSVGTALIGEDRWYLPIRAAVLGMFTPQDEPDPLYRKEGFRLQLSAGFGYRWMISDGEVPVYLVPTVGAAASYTHWTESTTTLYADRSSCSPASPCEMTRETATESWESYRLSPTVGLGLNFLFGEVAYQFQLDVEHHEQSTHQLTIGFQF